MNVSSNLHRSPNSNKIARSELKQKVMVIVITVCFLHVLRGSDGIFWFLRVFMMASCHQDTLIMWDKNKKLVLPDQFQIGEDQNRPVEAAFSSIIMLFCLLKLLRISSYHLNHESKNNFGLFILHALFIHSRIYFFCIFIHLFDRTWVILLIMFDDKYAVYLNW